MPGPTARRAAPVGRARTLAQVYRHFGEVDAAGTSPLYERVAVAGAWFCYRPVSCDDRNVADSARARREAIRQLTGLRNRLAAAEDTLAEAQAAMKRAEAAFDAASDRFTSAEAALDAAREERAQARQARYAARQAYERARTAADRVARRVRETSEQLDDMT